MVGGELLQASAAGEQDEYHRPHPSALSLSTQTSTTSTTLEMGSWNVKAFVYCEISS